MFERKQIDRRFQKSYLPLRKEGRDGSKGLGLCTIASLFVLALAYYYIATAG